MSAQCASLSVQSGISAQLLLRQGPDVDARHPAGPGREAGFNALTDHVAGSWSAGIGQRPGPGDEPCRSRVVQGSSAVVHGDNADRVKSGGDFDSPDVTFPVNIGSAGKTG